MPETSSILAMIVGGPRSGETVSVEDGRDVVILQDPLPKPTAVLRKHSKVPVLGTTTHITTYKVVSFCMNYDTNQYCYYLVPMDKDQHNMGGVYVLTMLNKVFAAHNANPE